jgi:hypothetical protein
MGVKRIPRLDPKGREMKGYLELREKYKDLFNRLNDMRISIGKRPIKEVKDYMTFFRTFENLKRMGDREGYKAGEQGINLVQSSRAEITNRYAQFTETSLPHKKLRKKKAVGGLMRDPFRILDKYSYTALRHIHMSPIVAKVAEARTALRDIGSKRGNYQLSYYKPKLDSFLLDWSNHIAGRQLYRLPKPIDKGIRALNKNLAFSILSYNARSAAIQFTAILNTNTRIGTYYTMKGIASTLSARKYRRAHKLSNLLDNASMDVHINEFFNSIVITFGTPSLNTTYWQEGHIVAFNQG